MMFCTEVDPLSDHESDFAARIMQRQSVVRLEMSAATAVAYQVVSKARVKYLCLPMALKEIVASQIIPITREESSSTLEMPKEASCRHYGEN